MSDLEQRLAALEAAVARQAATIAERDATIEKHVATIAKLEKRVAELETKLGQNSSNSSLPPSTDRGQNPRRNAKKGTRRKKRKKRAGGGRHRELRPADQVDAFHDHFPSACGGCGKRLPKSAAAEAQRDLRYARPVGGWDVLRKKMQVDGAARSWPEAAMSPPAGFDGRSLQEYVQFMREFGAGTYGGFLHFAPLAYVNRVDERIAHLIDESDRDEFLDESGPLLVFAHSDNGDSCCMNPKESTSEERSPIYRIPPRSFDGQIIAPGLIEFMLALVDGDDLFGVGALEPRFSGAAPYGPLAE